jgi:phosphoribosylaminoimidazole carboxylase (NCAIR synthetase)
MQNLLGPESVNRLMKESILPVLGPKTHFHWYGKAEVRPWRKMGHINGNVHDRKDLHLLFEELEHCRQAWVRQVSEIPTEKMETVK